MSHPGRPDLHADNPITGDERTLSGRLPALAFAVLLAAGVLLGEYAPWQGLAVTVAVGTVLTGLLCAAGRFFRRERLFICAVAVLLVCSGFVLYRLHGRDSSARVAGWDFAPGETALIGQVEGPPWRVEDPWLGQSRTRFRFMVEQFRRPDEKHWRRGGFGLLVEAPGEWESRLDGAERLALLARLRNASGYSNPGLFDYREYLQEQGLAGLARVEDSDGVQVLSEGGASALHRLRSKLNGIHRSLYPDLTVRGVAGALLLGVREQNPRPVQQDFILSGTVHVLVVSGLHVGYIAVALSLLVSLVFGRGWFASVITFGGVLAFAFLCGAGPSVLRAAFMCALVLFALPMQRPVHLLNILSAAFAFLLLCNPRWLFDPGFQLSFAAVAGIICLTPLLERPFRRFRWFEDRWKRQPVRAFLASLAAQMGVAPLLAWYFGGISVAGLMANLIMVPLSGFAVSVGFLADLAALVWLPAGQVLGFLNSWLIRGMLLTARFFAGLEWSWQALPLPRPLDVAFFWALLWQASRLFLKHKRAGAHLALTAALWLNSLAWAGPAAALGGGLRLDILDLGRTGAAALRFPSGDCLLETPERGVRAGYSTAREIAVPYLERNHIGHVTWLYLAGVEPSRIRWAWDILDCVEVRNVLLARSASADSLVFQFLNYAQSKGARLVELSPGDSLNLDGVRAIVGARGVLRLDCRGMRLSLEQGAWRLISGTGRKLTVVSEQAKSVSGKESAVLKTMREGAVRLEFRQKGKVCVRTMHSGTLPGL